MDYAREEIMSGVHLTHIRSDKFKSACLSVTLLTQLKKETAAMNALLPQVLRRNRLAADAFWTEERLARAAGVGLDRYRVTVLASIVKGESNYRPELPRVAGVYLNRLRRGMKLRPVRKILRPHLQFRLPLFRPVFDAVADQLAQDKLHPFSIRQHRDIQFLSTDVKTAV